MIFKSLTLKDGTVMATAEGHPSDVVVEFRSVCDHLLSGRGPWRITDIVGSCPDGAALDSEMTWDLVAKVKIAINTHDITRGTLS